MALGPVKVYLVKMLDAVDGKDGYTLDDGKVKGERERNIEAGGH